MKPTTIWIGIAMATAQFGAAAQVPSQAGKDYELGMTLGLCVAKCQVFHGFLPNSFPKSGEPVSIRVDQTWSGTSPAEAVLVPYETAPSNCSGDGGCPVASAWMNAKVSPTGPVVVVLGTEKGFGILPGVPVLLTSDDHEVEVIRQLTAEAPRLEGSLGLTSEAISSLSDTPEPALAGYIYARLKFWKAPTDTDRWADVLWQLIQSPSVPADRRDEIAAWAVSCYDNLSPAGRLTLVNHLREFEQGDDILTAVIGAAGLAEVASHDGSVELRISPTKLVKLRNAYPTLVSMGSIYSNHGALKAILGIK